jgi:hypothetical protein
LLLPSLLPFAELMALRSGVGFGLFVIVLVVFGPSLPVCAVPVARISYVLGAEVRLGFDIPVILLTATEGLEQLCSDLDGTMADRARVDRITPAEE